MLHLAPVAPDARWIGIDKAENLLDIGRNYLDDRFELRVGDLYDLSDVENVDVSFSIMVLSWLAEYQKPVSELIRITNEWIFASSLFSDGNQDAYVRVRGGDFEHHYNVYSLPRFEQFCLEAGARKVHTEPFEIDIDLPKPDHGGMQTWTEQTADGRRLQFSGPVWMPWWFVAIEL